VTLCLNTLGTTVTPSVSMDVYSMKVNPSGEWKINLLKSSHVKSSSFDPFFGIAAALQFERMVALSKEIITSFVRKPVGAESALDASASPPSP